MSLLCVIISEPCILAIPAVVNIKKRKWSGGLGRRDGELPLTPQEEESEANVEMISQLISMREGESLIGGKRNGVPSKRRP